VFNRHDAAQVARGLLMGSADIVPGVSGGTVALVVGIYNRLVTALSRFDLATLELVRRGRFAEAAARIDLRFLIFLGIGIVTAILTLSGVIRLLLEEHRQQTYAAFFGMILGSSLLVAQLVPRWSVLGIVVLLSAAAGAFVFVGLPQFENPPQFHPLYLFVCGFVAICAMILPGVSGSFLLLVLGAYKQILDLLHRLKALDVSANDLLCFTAFSIGMASGLICFTKILRWLLSRYEAVTLALLTGFMLGSLRRLWPFQVDLTPEAPFDRKSFQAVLPDFADGATWLSLLLIAVGFVLVLSVESIAARRMKAVEADLQREERLSEKVAV
jgi:putative membrane protein